MRLKKNFSDVSEQVQAVTSRSASTPKDQKCHSCTAKQTIGATVQGRYK